VTVKNEAINVEDEEEEEDKSQQDNSELTSVSKRRITSITDIFSNTKKSKVNVPLCFILLS
jgi:hypothetical protein